MENVRVIIITMEHVSQQQQRRWCIAPDLDSGVNNGFASRMSDGNNNNNSVNGDTMRDGHMILFKLQSCNTTFT